MQCAGSRRATCTTIFDRFVVFLGGLSKALGAPPRCRQRLKINIPALIVISFLCSFRCSTVGRDEAQVLCQAQRCHLKRGVVACESYRADIQFYPSYIPAATVAEKCWLTLNRMILTHFDQVGILEGSVLALKTNHCCRGLLAQGGSV